MNSDDEEDTHHLIQTTPKSPHHPSPFHIDNNRFNNNPNHNNIILRFFYINKTYILALTLPLIILFLFFTTDIHSLFTTNPTPSIPSNNSQLKTTLFLLKQQQSQLISLLNNNPFYSSSSNSNSSSNSSSSSYTYLRSALLHQLSLNNQIQLSLLNTNNINSTVSDVGYVSGCKKIDYKLNKRRTIEWKPKKDKFLFAICTSGQMSNHLICLEKHMFFAAVLNRVLVIPSAKVDYEFNRVLDIDHINKCLGREVVVTFEAFAASRKSSRMRVDEVLCYFALPQACYVDDEHVKKLKDVGVSLGEVKSVWSDEDVKKPSARTVNDVKDKFSSNAEVIAIGDVFFADVEKEWVMQPGGPIAHTCQTLIEPSRVILLTAQRFIQTFLGEKFVALHFRRHGFLKFCNAKNPSCFFPIPQAAECISRLVERANVPVIYLSTDAAESETGLLQSLVTLNGKTVPLVTRPPRNSAEKWDALLYRKKLDGDSQVEAMLDKTISALSAVFIGAPGSTFTEDILRLRRGWGTASECDEYLCEGEVPNFIAGDE